MMRTMTEERKPSLFKRQKLLLALTEAFGGKVNNTDFQKYLFLFTQLYEQKKSYEFVPYKFGCFSFQSYADRRYLERIGAITNSEHNWQLSPGISDFIAEHCAAEKEKIIEFTDQYKKLKGKDLIRFVYRTFPYYATKSEIADKILNCEERDAIQQERPADENCLFFTIGYEGKSFDNYLNRLMKNNVKMVCDVRKNPLSRKYGFSKKTLAETLDKVGIRYVHIPELGISSEKRQTLLTKQDYVQLFDDYESTTLVNNREALDILFQIFLKHKRVAITCFEAEQCMCHRSRIAKALSEHPSWQYEIVHI